MIASCNPTADDDVLLEQKDRPESLDTESPGSLITVIRSLKNYRYLTFPREKLMFLERATSNPQNKVLWFTGLNNASHFDCHVKHSVMSDGCVFLWDAL